MTNKEKKKIAEAARTVAEEVRSGVRFEGGSPFYSDGSPKCAMGQVLVLAGYHGKEGDTTDAVDSDGEVVDVCDVFHTAIDDDYRRDQQLVARIWKNNDRGNSGALAEALIDFASEVEKHIEQ